MALTKISEIFPSSDHTAIMIMMLLNEYMEYRIKFLGRANSILAWQETHAFPYPTEQNPLPLKQ